MPGCLESFVGRLIDRGLPDRGGEGSLDWQPILPGKWTFHPSPSYSILAPTDEAKFAHHTRSRRGTTPAHLIGFPGYVWWFVTLSVLLLRLEESECIDTCPRQGAAVTRPGFPKPAFPG